VTSSVAVFEAAILVNAVYMTKSRLKPRKKELKWKSEKFLHKYLCSSTSRWLWNGIHSLL